MAKISGPMLDRIDIHVDVPAVDVSELVQVESGETSETIRSRVIAARQIQNIRFTEHPHLYKNADMSTKDLALFSVPTAPALKALSTAMIRLHLSARAYDRIIKVSRTIADLAASEEITEAHVQEAIQYRNLDRPYWNA